MPENQQYLVVEHRIHLGDISKDKYRALACFDLRLQVSRGEQGVAVKIFLVWVWKGLCCYEQVVVVSLGSLQPPTPCTPAPFAFQGCLCRPFFPLLCTLLLQQGNLNFLNLGKPSQLAAGVFHLSWFPPEQKGKRVKLAHPWTSSQELVVGKSCPPQQPQFQPSAVPVHTLPGVSTASVLPGTALLTLLNVPPRERSIAKDH